MIEKEFVRTNCEHALIGDSRDIAVSWTNRGAVWSWCCDNEIFVEYQGSLNGTDIWRVRDDKQRAWFALRWL